MAKTSHVHKFKRLRYKSGNEIFFCCLPDCNQKINISLALGKRSICWRCGAEFIMSDYSIRLAKPHCENCHKPKKEVKGEDNIERNPDGSITYGLERYQGEEGLALELSLSERLQQTIKQPQIEEEDEI